MMTASAYRVTWFSEGSDVRVCDSKSSKLWGHAGSTVACAPRSHVEAVPEITYGVVSRA